MIHQCQPESENQSMANGEIEAVYQAGLAESWPSYL